MFDALYHTLIFVTGTFIAISVVKSYWSHLWVLVLTLALYVAFMIWAP